MEIINYKTTQKGYGRQGLYVDVECEGTVYNKVFLCDVYPNLEEYFQDKYNLIDAISEDEEGNLTDGFERYYTKENIFNTKIEMLNKIISDGYKGLDMVLVNRINELNELD